MKLAGKIFLGSLAAGAAYLLFGKSAEASPEPPPAPPSPNALPLPFPIPPGPSPKAETYARGESVLVPLLAVFPTGPSFPVDPTLLAGDEAVDAVRVLIDQVLPAGLLQGRVTAYHYGGPSSDGWKLVEPPVPTPPFPARAVTGKLLPVR